jgi:hypothetical protein
MKVSPDNLANGLDLALHRYNTSLEALLRSSDEVIVFGSRAAGLATVDSDWDVLVVGTNATAVHSKYLDLVVVDPAKAMMEEWLGSELASHVARHGVWLKGAGAWRALVRVSPTVVSKKAARLRRQVETFGKLFERSESAREGKHRTLLRRSLQRLHRMQLNEPVPPTLVLDEEWESLPRPKRDALLQEAAFRHAIGGLDVWRRIIR